MILLFRVYLENYLFYQMHGHKLAVLPTHLVLLVPDPKYVALVPHRGLLPSRRVHPVALQVRQALKRTGVTRCPLSQCCQSRIIHLKHGHHESLPVVALGAEGVLFDAQSTQRLHAPQAETDKANSMSYLNFLDMHA